MHTQKTYTADVDYTSLKIGSTDELELSFTSEEQQCVQIAVHNDELVETNEDFNVLIFPGIGPNIVVNSFADKVIVIIEDSSSKTSCIHYEGKRN